MKDYQQALSLACERYAVASTKADEMDALYDVIVGELHTGQVDEAVRRGHYMITEKLPREAWQDNLVDWVRCVRAACLFMWLMCLCVYMRV